MILANLIGYGTGYEGLLHILKRIQDNSGNRGIGVLIV